MLGRAADPREQGSARRRGGSHQLPRQGERLCGYRQRAVGRRESGSGQLSSAVKEAPHMHNAIQTKLLLIIIALLASIASYLGYEKHKQDVAEERAQQLFRPMRPDEKQ